MTKILVDSELLERALAAIDSAKCDYSLPAFDLLNRVEDDLRAALDAPQQEAVAYRYKDRSGYICYEASTKLIPSDLLGGVEPLYTHPAPSVPEGWQWVPKEPTPEMLLEGEREFRSYAFRWVLGHPAVWDAMLSAAPKAPTTDDQKDAERWRYIRRHLCLTGNGDGTCQMYALNLPCRIQGWPEIGESLQFHDAAIDSAIAAQKETKE